MFTIRTDLRPSIRSIAVAFYTYILHTRIDIEVEDIVFVSHDEAGILRRYIIDANPQGTFFDMQDSAIILPFNLKDLNDSSISLLYTHGDGLSRLYDSFCITIHENDYNLQVTFYKSFTHAQRYNFERFFIRVIQYSTYHSECKLSEYSILMDSEIQPLIHVNDLSKKKYNPNDTVLSRFYEFYLKSPSKECVVYNNAIYSYKDIERQSNRIANCLFINNICVHEGVVLYLDRSDVIISAILAIMKLRCYYLPVDISTPIGRLVDIQTDSHIHFVLTDSETISNNLKQIISGCTVINLEKISDYEVTPSFERRKSSPDDTCYMIYTSGSTGKPKGVRITNRNVANFISNNIIDSKVKDLSIANPCLMAVNKVGFDAFVADTLLALACGYKIVMASSEELANPYLFNQSIKQNRVNIIQTTPTRLTISILNHSPETLRKIRIIVCGGESLISETISAIMYYAPCSTLINVYGPTETTVWSINADISKGEMGIGKPAQNAQCYILNRYKKFVPNYETGVLYIGGDGLGSYPFDNVSQQEKFLKIPGLEGRLYDSGDTAYMDDNSNFYYVSRLDSQVKINGIRIELEEIESVAKEYKQILLCAASVKSIPGIGNRLVFYYTSNVKISRDFFVKRIFNRLPSAYVPNYFVRLKSIPLTTSNKIDRRALPIPLFDSEGLVMPRTEIQRAIYKACQREKPGLAIGVNRSLAELGFTSIDMPSIVSILEENGIKIEDYRIINTSFSIEQIAIRIENSIYNQEYVSRSYPKSFFEKYKENSLPSNYLLTGASGFLGSHILYELISNTSANVICFVHRRNIKDSIKYYWPEWNIPEDRVKYIYGSLDKENLGLSEDDLRIAETADAIINCAAIVKYYGDYEKIHRANVLSVKNLIEFSLRHNIVFNHISTLSVLGTNPDNPLTEKDFWVGQNEIFANQYIESKFAAENEVRKGADKGLKYRIFRVGRLSWRTFDKKFQINSVENEFYSMILSFIRLHQAPIELKDTRIEISPVDFCAKAIVNLCNQKFINGVFHVMNNNLLSLETIVKYLNKNGLDIRFVPMNTFIQSVNSLEDSSPIKKILQICCIRENGFIIENNPAISNEATMTILGLRMNWPYLNEKYFRITTGG